MHAKYQTNEAYVFVFTGENLSKKPLDAYWAQVQVKVACLVELERAEDFLACLIWK